MGTPYSQIKSYYLKLYRLSSVGLDFVNTWPNRHPSWFYSRNNKQVNYYGLSFIFLFYCIYWFLFKKNVLRLVHFLCCYLCWFFCIVMLFLSELSVMYWGSYQLWIREAGNWSKSKTFKESFYFHFISQCIILVYFYKGNPKLVFAITI